MMELGSDLIEMSSSSSSCTKKRTQSCTTPIAVEQLASLSTGFMPIDSSDCIITTTNATTITTAIPTPIVKDEKMNIKSELFFKNEYKDTVYDGWNKQTDFDSHFDTEKLLDLISGKKPKKRDNEERNCPIRSNLDKIRNFITDVRANRPFLEKTLKETDISYRQNELRRFLLMRAYVWNLTKFKSLDEMGKLLEGTKISNDHFKHCIVPSYALHAILLVVMEPLMNLQDDEDAQFSEFIKTYHQAFGQTWVEKLQRNCDPTHDAGGWFAQFRALQLMRAFLQILPPKTNRQIICTTVTILSQPPGSQGVSHGSWKSAALTRAHLLFDSEAYHDEHGKAPPTAPTTDDFYGDQKVWSPNKRQKTSKKYFTEKYQGLPVCKKLGVLERERKNISPLVDEKEAAMALTHGFLAQTVLALGSSSSTVGVTKSKCIKCSFPIVTKFHCTNPNCDEVTSEVDNLEESFDGELLPCSQDPVGTQDGCTQDTFNDTAKQVEFNGAGDYRWGSQQSDYIGSQQSQ